MANEKKKKKKEPSLGERLINAIMAENQPLAQDITKALEERKKRKKKKSGL